MPVRVWIILEFDLTEQTFHTFKFTAIFGAVVGVLNDEFWGGNNSCLSIRKINKQSVDLYHLLKENIPVGIST